MSRRDAQHQNRYTLLCACVCACVYAAGCVMSPHPFINQHSNWELTYQENTRFVDQENTRFVDRDMHFKGSFHKTYSLQALTKSWNKSNQLAINWCKEYSRFLQNHQTLSGLHSHQTFLNKLPQCLLYKCRFSISSSYLSWLFFPGNSPPPPNKELSQNALFNNGGKALGNWLHCEKWNAKSNWCNCQLSINGRTFGITLSSLSLSGLPNRNSGCTLQQPQPHSPGRVGSGARGRARARAKLLWGQRASVHCRTYLLIFK